MERVCEAAVSMREFYLPAPSLSLPCVRAQIDEECDRFLGGRQLHWPSSSLPGPCLSQWHHTNGACGGCKRNAAAVHRFTVDHMESEEPPARST